MQRSVKFVRYLREFGYEPVVVTGPGAVTGRWTPTDDTLAADVPARAEVRRIPEPPPAPSSVRRRLERWLRVPAPFDRWWTEGTAAAAATLSDIDLVYASMSPFSTAAAAEACAHSLGVPWVADLRDPWALDEMTVYPTRAHRVLERRAMGRALRSAGAVVMNTPEAARALRESFAHLRRVPVVSIPNGYDAADFDARPAAHTAKDSFRIVHTGYLHTELGLQQRRSGRTRRLLGGGHPSVDFLTRSHVFLLQAVETVLALHPDWRERIEVHLAGVLSASDEAVISGFRFHDVVRAPGYVSHEQTVELIRGANLLFLPMHDLPPGTRATIVPGKTYEYLASGRPLLAAVPDGDARDLVQTFETSTVCRPADVPAMVAAIETTYGSRRLETPEIPEAMRRYERRALTRELATVFDATLGRRS